jgi:hypothetical protein
MPLYLDDGCGGIIRFIRWSNTARPLRCTKRCVLPPLDAAIFNFNKAYSTLCHRECCDASCQCANISESGDSGDTRGMEQQKNPHTAVPVLSYQPDGNTKKLKKWTCMSAFEGSL